MTEYVGAIEKLALKNTYFQQVLFTAKHSQLVVMCLEPGEEIEDEIHTNVDQFFRIERGEARFVFDEKEQHLVREGDEKKPRSPRRVFCRRFRRSHEKAVAILETDWERMLTSTNSQNNTGSICAPRT